MPNKSSLNFLFLLCIALIFGGCNRDLAAPAPKVIPEWVNAPLPRDNERFIYGMGIDSNREAAIKVALNDMVAKLGTTIESSYESSKEAEGAYLKSTFKSKIKSEIAKIKINNYRVINSYKLSYREFAVLVETDKKRLLLGLKEDLKVKKKSIMQSYTAIKNSDALTRYNRKKELSVKANDLLSKVFIIAELDSNFKKQKNLEFIAQKQQEFLDESERLKFYVSGDKNSAKFVSIIKSYLAQNGFNVTNSKKDALHIDIKTTENIGNNRRVRIAVLTLDIIVSDDSRYIGGKLVVLKERYNGSKPNLYKNASIHLRQDINSKGINELLGIHFNIE